MSRPARRAIGILLAVFSGIALAVQGRLNGELGGRLQDGFLAALISFGSGWLLLLVALPVLPSMRRGPGQVAAALRAGRLRWWMCLGGLGGATLVAGQGLTVGELGVAMFTVAVVAGQSGNSLVIDRIGLGPAGAQRMNAQRVLGALLTLLAVIIAMSGRLEVSGAHVLLLLLLPLVAGASIAAQQAVNGRVGQCSSPLTATLINFTGGTIALAVAWVIKLLVRGGPADFPANPVLYIGGLLGITFIAVAAVVVRTIGVLLLGMGSISGQLIGAAALDLITPAHGEQLAASTLWGVALTLVAVAIATLPGRGSRTGQPPPAGQLPRAGQARAGQAPAGQALSE